MAQAGIRYFSAAPNYFDRIGTFMVEWQDKPFWWVSPSGREEGASLGSVDRVCHVAHHEAHAGLGEQVPGPAGRGAYPYDIRIFAGQAMAIMPNPIRDIAIS